MAEKESDPKDTTFATKAGRLHLYQQWLDAQITQKAIDITRPYTIDERRVLFTDWLRTLVAQHLLLPNQRLPPYRELMELPFQLREKDIAQAIRQLREEQLLPARKVRKDAGMAQWTPRDELCLRFIGEMRALRFDQVRELLARESAEETPTNLLSVSRASEIVTRWTREKLVVFRPVFHGEPGWLHLTHKGLRFVDLDYRAEPPSVRILNHLYWINRVRLKLEWEMDEDEMAWISERAIQAEQEKRQKGQRLAHIPDGILVLYQENGSAREIDIEVQVSKPSASEVQKVIENQFWSRGPNNPVRYYVNHLSKGVVEAVQNYMIKERKAMRQIEIIDLEK